MYDHLFGVSLSAVWDVINFSLLVVLLQMFSLVRTMGPVVVLLSPSWCSTQKPLKILELKYLYVTLMKQFV